MLTPLSHKDAMADAASESGDGIVPFGSNAPPDTSRHRDSSGKLDKYVEGVVERHFSDQDDERPAKRKSLDVLLNEGLERTEARETEDKEFEAAKPSRDYLRGRYPQGDLGRTCDLFLDWSERFKGDPRRAADEMATAYLLDGSRLDPERKQTKRDPNEHSNFKLGRIIDDAIDGGERGERKVSEAQLGKLRALFPELSGGQILARMEKIDRDLCADPIGGAATLAAMFGMPVTQTMQEAAQQQAQHAGVDNWLGQLQTSGQLPRLHELAPIIETTLRNPNFTRSGDINNDLGRAYSAAQSAVDGVKQIIGSGVLPLLPQVYGTVMQVLANPRSFQRTGTMGGDLGRAYDIAVQRSSASRVAKARQAQSPRSRGTAPNNSGGRAGSSLDAAIGNAMAGAA